MAGWFLFVLTFPIRNEKKGEAARRNEAGGEKKPLLFPCPKFWPNKLFQHDAFAFWFYFHWTAFVMCYCCREPIKKLSFLKPVKWLSNRIPESHIINILLACANWHLISLRVIMQYCVMPKPLRASFLVQINFLVQFHKNQILHTRFKF